jgi:uncharacterized protein
VINSTNSRHPRELYEFFRELGCHKVGFNLEELEGVNVAADVISTDAALSFWKGILDAWSGDPRIEVRELNAALSFADAVLHDRASTWRPDAKESLPTVAWNGDVVLLSPELAGMSSERYGNFVIGNVLNTSLVEIVRSGSDSLYVRDFVAGVEQCQATCRYFNFCRGGQASNKIQEHGRADATETDFCRNTKQRLLDALIHEELPT